MEKVDLLEVNRKLNLIKTQGEPLMHIPNRPRIAVIQQIAPAALVLLLAAPALAQVGGSGSPFDSTLNSLLTFAQGTFAKIAAILAVIFGGWQVLSGDGHGKRAIGGIIVGVGLMVYAAPLINWLFP
jgi:type IV secretory pathway VirB2 component (pilin)